MKKPNLVLWHHFPSATDTLQPMNQAAFPFDLNGKTPAGFVNGKVNDAHLICLADGILPEPFGVELVTPYSFGGQGWALFFSNNLRADAVRGMVPLTSKAPLRIAADQPCRTLKITSDAGILPEWRDVFDAL